MANQSDWLRLQLGTATRAVNADAYCEVFRETLSALKALDRVLSSHGGETIQWEITEAGSNSPLFAKIASGNPYGAQIIALLVSGLVSLSGGTDCPPHFTTDVLRHVKQIVAVSEQYDLRSIVSTSDRSVAVHSDIGRNASWALRDLELRKPTYTERGSLEGVLKELRAADRRDKILIVDRLTGEETPCYLNPEKLAVLDEQVRQAWKKRISVIGQVTVNRVTGKPVKVLVDEIYVFLERHELPQIEDLRGIDITDGVDPVHYIRGLRDAE